MPPLRSSLYVGVSPERAYGQREGNILQERPGEMV